MFDAALVGLGVELPDARVAETVRVRIARQHIARNLLGEIPSHRGGIIGRREGQIHRGQAAGMAAVARPDQEGNKVALAHGQIDDRPYFQIISAPGRSTRQTLPGRAAPQLQRPGNPRTAFGVGSGDATVDSQAGIDGTPPAHRRPQGRGGVQGHAMGLHVPRNADVLVRGVCDEERCFGGSPTFDKIEARRGLDSVCEKAVDPDLALRAHAEVVEPGRKAFRLHSEASSEFGHVGCARGGVRGGGKAARRAGKKAVAAGGQFEDGRARVAQREIGMPGGDQPRASPENGRVRSSRAGWRHR